MGLVYQMGVTNGDYHLQVGSKAYFIWLNTSGTYCETTAAFLMDQKIFKASTFVGVGTFNGYQCNVFNATSPLVPNYYTVGYIDVKESVPRGIFTHASFGGLVVQAYQEVRKFTTTFPAGVEETLFAVPAQCPHARPRGTLGYFGAV